MQLLNLTDRDFVSVFNEIYVPEHRDETYLENVIIFCIKILSK